MATPPRPRSSPGRCPNLHLGPGCAVYAGRLLPQTRRLDVPEHARRRPWHLRLPVVRLQQQGEQAVRFGAEGKRLRRPCTGHTKAPTSPLAQAMEMSRLHEPLQIYLGPTRHVKREMICWYDVPLIVNYCFEKVVRVSRLFLNTFFKIMPVVLFYGFWISCRQHDITGASNSP